MPIVLVVGPDGAGKSTFSAEMARLIGQESIVTIHAFPRFFKLSKGKQEKTAELHNPHNAKSHGYVVSVVKVAIIYANWIAFFLTRQKSKLYVVERGWLDMYVDPKRYRLDYRVRKLVFFLNAFLPKFTFAVLLSGDPKVIFERKRELDIVEIKRQIEIWEQLFMNSKTANLVSRDSYFAAKQVLNAVQF